MAFFCFDFIATFAVSKHISIMKKLLLTLTLALFCIITANAQWYIGGSANANLNKDIKAFTLGPDVGYCIPNTPFSVACAIEYGGAFQKDEGYTHSLTVTPYFRYEICHIGERFSLFVDLVSDIDALELSFFDIGLSPGISFNLTEHWSAEFSFASLGYEWERVPDEPAEHRFVLDFATTAPSFGIYYNF